MDEGKQSQNSLPEDAKSAFAEFAQHLDRVTSYRALSLDEQGYNRIVSEDSIWPSGRLRTDKATIARTVSEMGVRRVFFARLYIGLGLLEYDPSLSLHDDGETAVCIAGGYMKLPHKKVHLMELSVPKIEVSGYKVCDIQDEGKKKRWFEHRGIWFDSYLERTERYTLYEIPFYSRRLRSLRIFETREEVQAYLAPFQKAQEERRSATLNE